MLLIASSWNVFVYKNRCESRSDAAKYVLAQMSPPKRMCFRTVSIDGEIHSFCDCVSGYRWMRSYRSACTISTCFFVYVSHYVEAVFLQFKQMSLFVNKIMRSRFFFHRWNHHFHFFAVNFIDKKRKINMNIWKLTVRWF